MWFRRRNALELGKSLRERVVTPIREFWIDHRWTDLLIAGFVVGIHALVVWRTGRFDVLSWSEAADRRGVYSAFAVVVSLTGALSGVAVSQLGSAKGPRAKALKRDVGKDLARSWRSIYVGSMGAALLAIIALMLDSTKAIPAGQSPVGHNALVAQWIFEFAIVYATMRFTRLTAIFEPMISAFAKDDVDPDEEPLEPALSVDPVALDARRRAAG